MKNFESQQYYKIDNVKGSCNTLKSNNIQQININLTYFLTKKFGVIDRNVINCGRI